MNFIYKTILWRQSYKICTFNWMFANKIKYLTNDTEKSVIYADLNYEDIFQKKYHKIYLKTQQSHPRFIFLPIMTYKKIIEEKNLHKMSMNIININT